MSVIGSAPSIGRSQSLRAPNASFLRAPPSSTTSNGPSYVSLFLTNLRLLDLDLRDDWPNITALTFSTKDAQQNQKKRIQCVEWALYHLFAIWDPEETRNKLQPFFPPLEQLQSLNLRAALFRSLDNAKKLGVLGRDTTLRKTMLDECKGERLEEVLAVFSNVVLKKATEDSGGNDDSIARQLAHENFSYHGEREGLNALILAHKVSLARVLKDKADKRERVKDFEQLLGLEDMRLIRRMEQLKEVSRSQKSTAKLSPRDAEEMRQRVEGNWSGNENWLEEVLWGRKSRDGSLLDTKFDKVWKHVEAGQIRRIEACSHQGLVDQLDARVREQEARLARWQAFEKQLGKSGSASPSKKRSSDPRQSAGCDLGFTKHQNLHAGSNDNARQESTTAPRLNDHRVLVESLSIKLAAVGKPKERQAPKSKPKTSNKHVASSTVKTPDLDLEQVIDNEDDWSSAESTEVEDSDIFSSTVKPSTQGSVIDVQPQLAAKIESESPIYRKPEISTSAFRSRYHQVPHLASSPPQRAVSPLPVDELTLATLTPKLTTPIDEEAQMADDILNSMAAASPSPKKRHTLSLAERTRLSMSRNTHSKFSDLHDEYEVPDLSRLSIRSRPSIAARTPSNEDSPDQHADLIERTRKSMAGFEAAQKKAQLERRRSVKEEKRKQRQSSYFPKVEEEAAKDVGVRDEMMEGDIDYDSVFMSRPKIATSPQPSPGRILEEDEDVG